MAELRLPPIHGRPVRIEMRRNLRDRRGAVHAGAFLRERRIAFDAELARDPREFARIYVHELFHFAWLRLGNARRWSYEALLRAELEGHARGELGWSAEWRKQALSTDDPRRRTALRRCLHCGCQIRRRSEGRPPLQRRVRRSAGRHESGQRCGRPG